MNWWLCKNPNGNILITLYISKQLLNNHSIIYIFHIFSERLSNKESIRPGPGTSFIISFRSQWPTTVHHVVRVLHKNKISKFSSNYHETNTSCIQYRIGSSRNWIKSMKLTYLPWIVFISYISQVRHVCLVLNPNPETIKLLLRPFPAPAGDIRAKLMGGPIYEEHGLRIELRQRTGKNNVGKRIICICFII